LPTSRVGTSAGGSDYRTLVKPVVHRDTARPRSRTKLATSAIGF